MKPISKLQFITTNAMHAEQACRGGVDWIQLRLKNVSYNDHYAIAREVKAVCNKYNATFIINDNVHLAMDILADGVHLGKEDMPPTAARQLLGDRYIIGSTANTLADLYLLSAQPIDYIGLGPYKFTNTKQNLSPILGLEGYNDIFKKVKENGFNLPPIIGIGGIAESDVAELFSTGLHGVAVSGALSNSGNVTDAARRFMNSINYQLQQ